MPVWVSEIVSTLVLPLLVLFFVAMLKGAVSRLIAFFETKYSFDISQEHEEMIFQSLNNAVIWVEHKTVSSTGDKSAQASRLIKAMELAKKEIVALGLADRLRVYTDERMKFLLESIVASRKENGK